MGGLCEVCAARRARARARRGATTHSTIAQFAVEAGVVKPVLLHGMITVDSFMRQVGGRLGTCAAARLASCNSTTARNISPKLERIKSGAAPLPAPR